MMGLNCVTSRDYAAWDKITLSSTFQSSSRAIQAVNYASHSPPQSQRLTFPQILHSPLLYFCPFLLSDPFRLALFPTFPSSRQPSSSDRGQRSSLDGLLWDKSLLLKIQQPLIHILVTRVHGFNCSLRLRSTQMLLKVPRSDLVWQVFLKKKQLGGKSICDNVRGGGNNKRQHGDTQECN